MGSITAQADQARGNIRVEINWQDFPNTRKAWVYRVVNGVRTLLREGNPVALSNGVAVLYDTEMPLDTPLTYRTLIALNQNGDMEDGVTQYVAATTGATVEQSKDYYVIGEGIASLKATPTGGATVEIMSELVPVTVGTLYTFSGAVMLPTWWNGGVQLIARFYTAGLAIVSTIAPAADTGPAAGEWNSGSPHYAFGNTAPATSAFVRIGIRVSGTPPVTMPIYVDELYITTSAGVVLSSPEVTLQSAGGGWLRDPLHPANDLRLLIKGDRACAATGIYYVGRTGQTRAADSAINEVPGAEYPVPTFTTRKSARSTLVVMTRTLHDRNRLKALHAPGAPLMLQLPAEYDVPYPTYQLHGDVELTAISQDQKHPIRLAQSPTAEMKAPVGPNEGVYGARYDDETRYTTFTAATAAGVTWVDLLQGELTL
jgi:hypothetical protein